MSARAKVYLDPNDWWIGYYRGPNHHYVCPLPTVVIRWLRNRTQCGDILESGDIHETCYLPKGHDGEHESEDARWQDLELAP
jgi:hypothetical protein